MRFLTNRVKKKLRTNKLILGSWLNIPSLETTEIMAKSGFEFLVIDVEHSSTSLESVQKMTMVMEGYNIIPFVRVEENNPVIIKKVLETGCYGILVPMVNNKEDAQKAVNSILYAPNGIRGVGLSRSQGYGLQFEKYNSWYKDNIALIAQIEHKDAIDNLEKILSVKGIDATIIGPYDLSASLGYPGEIGRKEVISAIEKYKKICKKFNKSMGIHVITPDAEEVAMRIKEGFTFVVFSIDMLFLGKKIRDELKRIGKK